MYLFLPIMYTKIRKWVSVVDTNEKLVLSKSMGWKSDKSSQKFYKHIFDSINNPGSVRQKQGQKHCKYQKMNRTINNSNVLIYKYTYGCHEWLGDVCKGELNNAWPPT